MRKGVEYGVEPRSPGRSSALISSLLRVTLLYTIRGLLQYRNGFDNFESYPKLELDIDATRIELS